MKETSAEFVFICPAEEISAYIDGELPADVEAALESHFAGCETCRGELNDQKGFLIALSDTLEREVPIELPENFTKTVVVNAESKVFGLRDRRERSPALLVGVVLLILAATAIGSLAGILSPVAVIVEKITALASAMIQVFGDLMYAIAAIFRAILQTQTFGPALAYIAVSLAVVMILYFGSRSLWRYFRTSGT